MSMRTFVLVLAAALGIAGTVSAETVKVGVSAGPHAQIAEAVKAVAAQKGLDIEIIEFSDYVVPNAALDAGEIQINSFQHQPYLDNQKADRGYKIESVGLTVNFPMGIYSKKYKTWAEIPNGSTIAIQNDPTNGGRTLLLLQDVGAIKLKPGVGFKPSVIDIVENPKKLKFVEVDAAQTPRSLDDVAAAAVNTNYVLESGLDPSSALVRESPKGPYVNVIAVRSGDKDKPWVKTFVESYHTPEVRAFIETTFKGTVLASW